MRDYRMIGISKVNCKSHSKLSGNRLFKRLIPKFTHYASLITSLIINPLNYSSTDLSSADERHRARRLYEVGFIYAMALLFIEDGPDHEIRQLIARVAPTQAVAYVVVDH